MAELRALTARGPSSHSRRPDPTEQWLAFAIAQRARAAAHPNPASLVAAAAPTPLRLCLSYLEGLPLFQAEQCNLEVRVGVTLFDVNAVAGGGAGPGVFFGNTCFSAPVAYDMRKSKGKKGFHVDLEADIFFHTRAALSAAGGGGGHALSAVVEVVLVERTAEGVVAGEFSAGWARVPLELLRGQSCSPMAPRGGSAAATPAGSPTKRGGGPGGSPVFAAPRGVHFATGEAGGTCFVPVFTGSPRYLLLKGVLGEQAYPPTQLTADGAECRLHYTLEVCPEMEAWLPLLPEHFLVSFHDVVPGLLRLDATSCRPTTHFRGAASLLLEGRGGLRSMHALMLRSLRLRLPEGFLDVVRKAVMVAWGDGGGRGSMGPSVHAGNYGGSSGRATLPLRELQQSLRLRASVHNGRTFVGPTLWAKPARLELAEGRRGEHHLELEEVLALAWVPGDVLVALVLELVLLPPGADLDEIEPGVATRPGCTVLTWGAAVPFSSVGGGGEAGVAEGQMQVAMRSGPGHWVRNAPVLDWRRLLEQTNRISPDPPLAVFQLLAVEGAGIWPPPPAPVALSLPRAHTFTAQQLPARQPSAESMPRHSRVPYKQPAAAFTPHHSHAPSNLPPPPPSLVEREVQVSRTTTREGGSVSNARGGRGGGGSTLQAHPSAASLASEAETFVAMREGTAGQEAPGRKGKALPSLGSYKPLERVETVQLWQINAHYQPPRASTSSASEDPLITAPPPPVKARQWPPAVPHTKSDDKALFAGSPTARGYSAAFMPAPAPVANQAGPAEQGDWWCPGSRGRAAVRRGDVAALAATATPVPHSLSRHISLAAELDDPLDTNTLTLQFVGYAPAHGISAESLAGVGREAVLAAAPDGGPGCLHFTFRLFTGDPTVTAAARPQLLPGSSGGRCRLFALVPSAAEGVPWPVTSSSNDVAASSSAVAAAAGVGPTLPLYSEEQLAQQLALLEAQGLGECRESMVRQLRIRAAQYLSQRWLQVDVWDSASLLQVGTFSVPLRGLLRQGQEVVEVVHECPLHDQAQMVQRDSESAMLASAPLRGSIFVRLVNRGSRGVLRVPVEGPPPARTEQGLAVPVVVRAKPALEEAGTIVQDLARAHGAAASPRTLKDEIIQRAQQKVQRILHYRHMSAPAGAGDDADVGQLVHDQLLTDIEQARDRCKPDVILKKLQQELPGNLVLCAGPGEGVVLEREFINPSHEEGWFEVASSSPGELALVEEGQEWQALSERAGHAGLLVAAGGSSGPRHVITSSRFKLGPQQRAVLRFKWLSALHSKQPTGPLTVTISVSRAAGHGGPSGRSAAGALPAQLPGAALQEPPQRGGGAGNLRSPLDHSGQQQQQQQSPGGSGITPAALACFRVTVLPQQLLVDRTLRLYHAAGAGQHATASQTVLLGRLPAAERLLCSDLRLEGSPGLSATVVRGSFHHQPTGALLSFAPPPSGSSLCCHVAALSPATSPGRPLEAWEVFVHSLPCLELSAVVGESVSLEKRVAAAAGEELQLSCHGLCRDELRISPAELNLRPGAQGRLQLTYTPQAPPRRREALLTLMDDARQRPIEMLLFRLDSTATRISRTFEVTLERGKLMSKKVSYTNPYAQSRLFAFRTTQPGLLRFAQPEMEMAAGATAQVRMTFSAGAHLPAGRSQEVLVFVDNVGDRRVEECFRIVLRSR